MRLSPFRNDTDAVPSMDCFAPIAVVVAVILSRSVPFQFPNDGTHRRIICGVWGRNPTIVCGWILWFSDWLDLRLVPVSNLS